MELGNWMALVQVAITLLIAALLHELTAIMSTRFLVYWSRAWLALAVALVAVVISNRIDVVSGHGTVGSILFQIVYCAAEYLFGFYLWIGCRNNQTGRECSPRDFRLLIVPGIAAVVLPLWFQSIGDLFMAHSAIMACFFLSAAYACRRQSKSDPMLLGMRLLRLSLYGLTILFAHYAVLVGWFAFRYPHLQLVHMEFSSLYDAGLEVSMAFGMVLLVTERIRGELLERNRKLAVATEELERVAKTDPLTGLLNRRAFDQLEIESGFGAVAIVDVNDLKPLNDEFGHSNGDVALQLVARSMRIHFRVTDPLFRLGGDEFAIVMVGCLPEELASRLAKIDEALAGQRLPGVEKPIDVKISWGVAAFESLGDLKRSAAKADERMFVQKKKRKGSPRSSLSSVTT